jgi:hypothetical protein
METKDTFSFHLGYLQWCSHAEPHPARHPCSYANVVSTTRLSATWPGNLLSDFNSVISSVEIKL